jgi:heme oxygenase
MSVAEQSWLFCCPCEMCGLDPASARFALRCETADAHGRLDALFSRFDLSDRSGYAAFLQAQAGAFFAVETALNRAGAGELLRDWEQRRRSDALLGDLRALALSHRPATSPVFATEAAILGGVYVLEGSRLGGAVLRRTVPVSLPTAFLSHGEPSAWRRFVEVLDERLTSPADLSQAALAAIAVFQTFETSATRILGALQP